VEGEVDAMAAEIAQMGDRRSLEQIRKDGTLVVPWEPKRQDLAHLLLFSRGGRGR